MGKTSALTFDERNEIERHIKNGLSCIKTGKLIGRSKNCVSTEVKRGGGSKFYSATVGQSIVDRTKQEKFHNLSVKNKGNKVTFRLKQRIENLEMQVEILHNAIKELMNK